MKVEFEEFHMVNSVCSSRLPLQKTKEDEVEKNVGRTRQINKEDEVESDKSESDREKEIKLIYVVKGGNKNKKNKKSVKK
jgi:hypothetical protein